MYNQPIQDRHFLPIINSKFRDIEQEKEKIVQNTLQFIHDRTKRSLKFQSPFANYPLYPQDQRHFLNNYPQSLNHYRPIRYFYQRPVQMDEKHCFPHQKEFLREQRLKNNVAEAINSTAKKYAKPLKFEDLIREGDEVNYPLAKIISGDEVRAKQNELRLMNEKLDPERPKKIRERNKKFWNVLRKLRYMQKFWKVCKEYTQAAVSLKKNKQILEQGMKADMFELINFVFNVIRSIEEYAIENFTEKLILDPQQPNKTEDSVFKIKYFVHKTFHDLTTNISTKEDIPDKIKKIMINYVTNNRILPEGFLTTFEFNRLEFDLQLRIFNMTADKQAMMVCFILLYRILVLEIFTNYSVYFRKLNRVRIKKEKSPQPNPKSKEQQEAEIKENIKHNFNLIIGITHYILKDAFLNTPKIYREHFKDIHVFKKLVVNAEGTQKEFLETKLKADLIEFSELIPQDPKVEDFVRSNLRWVNMYKMSAFAFSIQFAELLNV
jgi:hypothetical protein